MSALDPGLMAQLVAEPTIAEQALQKIANLYADNAWMSAHELRVLAIVYEGLGISAAENRLMIQAAIQRRRYRIEVAHGPWGAVNAQP